MRLSVQRVDSLSVTETGTYESTTGEHGYDY